VDGLFVLQAYSLEDKKIGKIIWSSRELPLAKMRAELWGADDFVQKYPEVTQLVATAFVRAQYWASQEQNRGSVILDGTRNGTPLSVVRRNVEDPKMPWKDRFSPLFDGLLRAQYQNDLDIAQSKGLIRRKPSLDELIDTRFAAAAIKQLGLQNYWMQWRADGAH
jgi:sulfonate transport system substrate-binding protein